MSDPFGIADRDVVDIKIVYQSYENDPDMDIQYVRSVYLNNNPIPAVRHMFVNAFEEENHEWWVGFRTALEWSGKELNVTTDTSQFDPNTTI